jgi:3-dehydroquinate dehydratase
MDTRLKLSGLSMPFMCLVVSEPTIKGCLKIIDRFEPVADSFEINLPQLDAALIGDVFHSTPRPCIATYRRSDFMSVYGYTKLPKVSDASRAESMKRAVALGASAVDFELDMFQPEAPAEARRGARERRVSARPRVRPVEFSTDRGAVRMQSDLASEIRDAGAEVIMSCHTQSVLREADALEIVHAVAGRGGQFAKLVSQTPSKEDVYELLGCAFSLNRKSLIPFTLMNVGPKSASQRLLSVLAGSSWVYCRPPSRHSYAGQPTFEDTKSFIESLGLREI